MPQVSAEQLAQHDDVCAICYNEMKTAHITPCGHIFHSMCLRKWLYVKESCPMCHRDIMWQDPNQPSTNNADSDPNTAGAAVPGAIDAAADAEEEQDNVDKVDGSGFSSSSSSTDLSATTESDAVDQDVEGMEMDAVEADRV